MRTHPRYRPLHEHAALDECLGRRFILSPTAGPFAPEADDRVLRNYRIFMDTAREYGMSH